MKRTLHGVVLCLALAASPAFAQEPAASRIDEARALIGSQGVGDLFEAVENESISVRHLASRLTCHFHTEQTTQRLIVFSGQPRGDDVGCASETATQAITLYATRYNPAITTEQAMAEAVAGIRNRFTDARPTPALLHMTSEGFPTPLMQHFLITLNGEQWITSAFVVRNGEWIIKVRYSERAADADALMQSQLESNAVMMGVLLEIRS